MVKATGAPASQSINSLKSASRFFPNHRATEMAYFSYLAITIRLVTLVFAAPPSPTTFRSEFLDGLLNWTWSYKVPETIHPSLL